MHSNVSIETATLFGVPIHKLTITEALDTIDEIIKHRKHLQIGVINAAKLVNMRRSPELKQEVLSSNLILADGIAVVWASRLLGRALPERVTGIDLMFGMLARGNVHGYRVYCLGASQEVLEQVSIRIAADYPKVIIVGRHHGYFSLAEEKDIVDEMIHSRPDILFVAMTSPKKEQFLARWSHQLGIPVCHGVGGSFDVMAGKVQRAPVIWQRLGLEWLYRVKQEPRRLWRRYLTTNTLFFVMLVAEYYRQFFKK